MAKILFGVGVADARNKLGGHVFSKNRNGAYVRMKVSPTQPRSTTQLVVRAAFAQFSKAWGGILDDAARAGFTSLAASNPVPDQFGNPQVLTGLQFFQRINRNLHTIGIPELDVAPADQAVTGLTAIVLAASAGAQTLTMTFAASPISADDKIVVLATPGLSPGKTFATSFLRLITVSAFTQASPLPLETGWLAKFGALVLGQKIIANAYVIHSINGAASGVASASCIVAA